jgi:23S rRNA (adenine2503-C2)-methyltransferase
MAQTREMIPVKTPAEARPVLLGQTSDELATLMTGWGEPAYRGRQIARWIYQRGAREFAQMTDLPAGLRARLAAEAIVGRSEVETSQRATDGTTKLLLRLHDDRKIETVLLPYPDRVSVCISSQVGCPVGCRFCATATMGFARNLTAGEMVDQVLTAADALESLTNDPRSTTHAPSPQTGSRGPEAGSRISHVVVMGMGEPLLNVPALVKAARLLHDEVGISYRHLTVSTAGYVPGIRALADEGLPLTLALSLHAPEDRLRNELIPLGKRFPLAAVMDAVRYYHQRTGRRVTLEYLLLGGVNDSLEHARELVRRIRGLMAHVNLIPWNPAETLSPYRAPSRNRVRAFRRALESAGLAVTQRLERGQEIDAACGQLAVRRSTEGARSPIGRAS